jgi:hypothetical protein
MSITVGKPAIADTLATAGTPANEGTPETLETLVTEGLSTAPRGSTRAETSYSRD